ncbi:hypothetical protein LRS10_18340 [Phenylobacterium sp. J426]|uniref:hypothetical protein n=1 Tax=Phenylobacterium sp. J426 TaxID=2898439 RepID=UPI002150C38D|nr:hypothetical protein [Phenylobacterium sp. J426]MCR5875935.1 hypothetical protein [Phenylobacterium sp. J426]
MAATPNEFGLGDFGAALAALSALSTAAFGLLDSSKALWGGISNVGKGHLQKALTPFAPALTAAVGADWWGVVRANWINGMPKADQKARVSALIKLGLSKETAVALSVGGKVDGPALERVAAKLAEGRDLTSADLNILGRMNAALEARLDYAFEMAEQQYRNVARLAAGAIAVALSLAVWMWWPYFFAVGEAPAQPSLLLALGVGLLAVPLAPVAKDLTSALSAALHALKAAKAV